MDCPNCGHSNPIQSDRNVTAGVCANCGERLEHNPGIAPKGQYPRRPKRKSAWLVKFFASSLASTALFFTVYALANALYAELTGKPHNSASDPWFGYVSLGLYFGAVAFAAGFMARIWRGRHFWPAALGAPMAMVLYSFLEQGSGMWQGMLVFLIAGVLGAQIGSMGISGADRARRSGK